MTSTGNYDFIVIGGGSGGVRAARVAGAHGARTALIESHRLGGTCVNVGCVPKKVTLMASQFSSQARRAAGFGWKVGALEHDWEQLRGDRAAYIARLNASYATRLANAGVTVVQGRGVIESPGRVRVGTQVLEAPAILIATGGKAVVPEVEGWELLEVSDDLFEWREFPRRLLVQGGGYIALEFASIMRGLGAEVTLVHRNETVLRGIDDEFREPLLASVARDGMSLRLGETISRVSRGDDGLAVTLSGGEVVVVDRALSAVGRAPNIEGLWSPEVAISLGSSGHIEVDRKYRTSVAGIFAIGDAIATPALTPTAIREGMIVASQLSSAPDASIDYDLTPTAIFTQPEISYVGLSERVARERFDDVVCYRAAFDAMQDVFGATERKTILKLVCAGGNQRIWGAHMMGESAAEIIQGLVPALELGATKRDFERSQLIHPTVAEELVSIG